jgi:CMP/dCMP kinase
MRRIFAQPAKIGAEIALLFGRSIVGEPLTSLIIAIDGPVGSGKSTLARRVAEMMGYVYIDTGAMYRAVALKALRHGIAIDPEHADALEALARDTRVDLRALDGPQQVFLDGEDVTSAIRTPDVAQAASKIAVIPGVRHVLVAEQRRAGQQGGVVMEGRDIGSVVFPDAHLKIFLTASPEVRAERRWLEHHQKGDAIDLRHTLEEIHERDRRDEERASSPLVRAPDAVVVDSTAMEAEEVARLVVMLAREQGNGKRRRERGNPSPSG